MTTKPHFDPNAPLAGPTDPWQPAPRPTTRSAPPYHMTDMVAAEPAVAPRVLERVGRAGGGVAELAEAIRATVHAGERVVFTGCGTSEHGALAAVEIVREAAMAAGLENAVVIAEEAFELSLAQPAGLVVGVTHEGSTRATISALSAAREAGRRTAVITAGNGSPAAALADIVVATGELDHSWCHTVGYLSPILVASAVGAALSSRPLDTEAIVAALSAGSRDESGADAIAARFADAAHLIVIASGSDRPAGRELALKVEEASWLPSAYRDLESFLHGHLPATSPATGLVLILTDRERRSERVARARQALEAARVIGLRTAAILTAPVDQMIDAELTPAGRLVVADRPSLPAPVASFVSSATPLQILTERLARARGTNPDLIRRDDAAYRRASEVAAG